MWSQNKAQKRQEQLSLAFCRRSFPFVENHLILCSLRRHALRPAHLILPLRLLLAQTKMNSFRTLLALFLALVALGNAFMIDTPEYGDAVEYMPKRSFQHIWRNIEMQMPSMQGHKRSESLSRARANAYYRLGK